MEGKVLSTRSRSIPMSAPGNVLVLAMLTLDKKRV